MCEQKLTGDDCEPVKPLFLEPRKSGRIIIRDKNFGFICQAADEWTRDKILQAIALLDKNHRAMDKDTVIALLRDAIQNAEQFGLVRTESGQVITGAIDTENGIVLVEE
ncbi:hypothetical protein U5315_002708 [Vibrio fluvialis]|nr:hypothetical protein [Vibrio fluvialis]